MLENYAFKTHDTCTYLTCLGTLISNLVCFYENNVNVFFGYSSVHDYRSNKSFFKSLFIQKNSQRDNNVIINKINKILFSLSDANVKD